MAAVAYLDTHVVAWLYAGQVELLTDRALRLLRDSDLLISPMVRLELQYLHEVGRTRAPAHAVIRELASTIGLRVCRLSFGEVVEKAERQSWTRDPFDRIIVAQAAHAGAALVTKDKTIQQNYSMAVW